MKIHWQEFDLNTVIKFFTDGFESRTDEKIIKSDWFIDQSQGKVIFRVYTEDKKDDE